MHDLSHHFLIEQKKIIIMIESLVTASIKEKRGSKGELKTESIDYYIGSV